ncbi:MAG TPA: hypothetical protein VNZ45_13180 [Bacteroidia bacterium]|nr:hypothetical protein [Bacteroidia bacterium]
MRTLLSIIVISICFCSCYHTDKQTIETLVAVNQSLIQAKNTVEEGNQYTQALLEKNLANDGRMVKPYYDKAMQVIHLSDSIVRQLQILKIKLAKEVGGMINYSDDSIEYMENKDAVAKCNGILIDDGYAKSLKTTLSKYRKEIIGLFNWKDAEGRNYLLQRDTAFLKIGLLMCDYIGADGKSSSWEEHNFEHAPLVADIESLTRLQIDVRNCESNIIKYFNSNVTSSCSWGRDFRPLIIYFNRYLAAKWLRLLSN